MNSSTDRGQLSEKDRLLTRPPGALPTPLDPAGPEAHGYPADPKPMPTHGQGDPRTRNPAPRETGRSA